MAIMNLRTLEQFITIAELGSLSKAAARLSESQPSLSRSLRHLEAQLGMPLFFRHGRGLTLTQAGDVFLQRARAALKEMETAYEIISDLNQNPGGTVCVGLPPGVTKLVMVEMVQRFSSEFPSASLKMIEMYTGDVLEQLAMGRIDIGVFYECQAAAAVSYEAIFLENLYVIGSPTSPIVRKSTCPFEVLTEIPLILPTRLQGVRSVLIGKPPVQAVHSDPLWRWMPCLHCSNSPSKDSDTPCCLLRPFMIWWPGMT